MLGSNAFILVYSITSKQSLDKLGPIVRTIIDVDIFGNFEGVCISSEFIIRRKTRFPRKLTGDGDLLKVYGPI
uniref:Uncharacterized protein n=1 Tax=Meloidogyne floridensis TaxID=298350 RepID=A0A915NFR7_9BILA